LRRQPLGPSGAEGMVPWPPRPGVRCGACGHRRSGENINSGPRCGPCGTAPAPLDVPSLVQRGTSLLPAPVAVRLLDLWRQRAVTCNHRDGDADASAPHRWGRVQHQALAARRSRGAPRPPFCRRSRRSRRRGPAGFGTGSPDCVAAGAEVVQLRRSGAAAERCSRGRHGSGCGGQRGVRSVVPAGGADAVPANRAGAATQRTLFTPAVSRAPSVPSFAFSSSNVRRVLASRTDVRTNWNKVLVVVVLTPLAPTGSGAWTSPHAVAASVAAMTASLAWVSVRASARGSVP
jgi:hypothetical protein